MTERPLDLVLVNPGARRQIYQALGASLSAIEPPVWTGLMATFARKRGFSVAVIDSHAEDLTPEETATRVAEMAPRLVVVVAYGHQPSASTQVMPAAGAICSAVKQAAPDLKVLLVGGHVAALPERTLREEAADFVCGGEGPYTLVDLLEAVGSANPDFSKVRGLWYRDGAAVRTTPPAPLVGNLDQEMPELAWDLLPMERYRAHNWHCFGDLTRQPYASLYTTLGCPYHCSFCCIQAPFKSGEQVLGYKESVNSYRFWDPKTTVDQIGRLIREYGVRNIKFADEMFVLNVRHVHGICDLIIERGYDVNIWAYARIDTVKGADTVEKLKRAGFNWLCFGVEAGSDRVRTDVDKRFDQDEIYKTIARVRSGGINVLGNYIFGLPEDDLDTMQETLDMALDLNTEFSNFYCLPPGTPVYTPDGTRTIESLRVGEEVLSETGRSAVKAVMSRPYSGAIYTITPRYLPSVRLTPEHPVQVVSIDRTRGNDPVISPPRWANPPELRPYTDHWTTYDAVVVPKCALMDESTVVDFSPFVNGHAGGGGRGGQLGPVGRRLLESWPVTPELAELFGWYVAEGSRFSRTNNQIGFHLGTNEPENIERVRTLVDRCFGYRTQVRTEDSVTRIGFVSKVMMRALPTMFGETSSTKNIPDFIMRAPADIASSFLSGYIAGDGTSHGNSNGQFSVSTCSEVLARQLVMLFLKTGKVVGFIETPAVQRANSAVPHSGRQFKLSWTNGGPKHYFQDRYAFYVPIKSVTATQYDGFVHNVETGDNTYAVPFLLHNCAMAYPGSQLYNVAVKNGSPLPEKWSGYSQHAHDTLPLPTRHISGLEVLRFRDHAFNVYFSDPRYLAMVERKFGKATVDHIREMASFTMTRLYSKTASSA